MPRTARYAPGGFVYHVLNRGVGRQQLFFNDDDYLAFERIIVETLEKRAMRILSYCLMVEMRCGPTWFHEPKIGSGAVRQFGSAEHRAMLSDWPLPRPRKWVQYVNQPASDAELEAIRRSCRRGAPYGSEAWVKKTAKKLGLESTLRSPGRPKKA